MSAGSIKTLRMRWTPAVGILKTIRMERCSADGFSAGKASRTLIAYLQGARGGEKKMERETGLEPAT